MSNQKEIDIVINTDGTIEIDQLGWHGKTCEGAVDDLVKLLGKEIKKERKQEWHKHQKNQLHQKRIG